MSSQRTPRLTSEIDAVQGPPEWKEGDLPPDVALAVCSLSGRDESYLRCLLVIATFRPDEPGKVIAAAARHLLRSPAERIDSGEASN